MINNDKNHLISCSLVGMSAAQALVAKTEMAKRQAATLILADLQSKETGQR